MQIIKKELDIDFIKKWMIFGIDPIILSILSRRGLTKEIDLLNIFLPLFELLESPFKFKDIIPACKRLVKAIDDKEKIIIFGDRDVDGTTSTVILYDFIKKQGGIVDWEVPIYDSPYGLDINNISLWGKKKYSLCFTVDCGITNINEIDYLKSNNIDVIIIDHHEPLSALPDAVSIINPKNEQNILFDNIAACFVTFLFTYGFLLYKNDFFNKKIALVCKDKGKLELTVFNNLIEIKKTEIDNIDTINLSDYFKIFYYEDNSIDRETSKTLLEKEIIILKPIYYIYNHSILKSINDINLKAKISLKNELLKNVENLDEIKKQYLPLVLLGTMADLMPLIDENRIITGIGLSYIKNNDLKYIENLCDSLNISASELSSKEISWYLCPILNAPGRMGDARITVDFLNNSNDESLIKKLFEINEQRKKKSEEAYNEFYLSINNNREKYDNNLAFFHSETIETGITGITATKLSKTTDCPIIVAAKQGDYYTGSIRGDSNYHFVDFLEKASNIFVQYGGHKSAAGFRFHEKNLEDFKTFLLNNSSLFFSKDKNDEIIIDAEIPEKYLNYNLYSLFNILEPFGNNNENPILFTQSLKVYNYTRIGKDKQHVKIYFDTKPTPFLGLYWNMGEWFENNFDSNKNYDVVYQLEINKYNGQITLQMLILDLKVCEK